MRLDLADQYGDHPRGPRPSSRRPRVGRDGAEHRFDQGRRPGLVDRAVEHELDHAVRVDEELGRQREHPVRPQDVPGAVEADRVVELVAVGVRADVGRRRLLDADADDREAAVAVLRVERAQDRRLLLARRAPRRPEVEPDDLAAEVVEPDRLAVEVGQLVGRAVDEGRGELGRRLARLAGPGPAPRR